MQEEYSCYFAPRRYDQLLRESQVIEDVSKVLECEAALPLTALIGPNIIIGRSFDSAEAAIAMNFVRATGVQGRKIAPEKRIYATLAISGEALINTEQKTGSCSISAAIEKAIAMILLWMLWSKRQVPLT